MRQGSRALVLYLALAAASFSFVFLKAFQQRSVAFDNFIAVIPVSILMAAMEVFTITRIAATGWHWLTVLCIGLASGLGAVMAMLLHRRIFRKEKAQ